MKKSRQTWGDRFYRALLRLLPFDFRQEFGDEMEDVFREQRADVSEEKGSSGIVRIWWNTALDIFRMAPREHWSVFSADARYALRMMKNNPGFTLAVILILGLGAGANTAIFSVINSVLLKPLPYIEGDHLVILRQPEAKLGTDDVSFSVPEIMDYRQRSRSLSSVVEYHSMTFTLYGKESAHRVRTGVVSPQFFDVFGVRPLLGRTFIAADDRAGAERVLVLSYEFWRQIERGDPNIIGKRYEMNDSMHTVIGVLPQIPQYPDENDVYMPTSSCPFRSNPAHVSDRNMRMFSMFGRLKAGETLDHCSLDLSNISHQLQKDYPDAYPKSSGMTTTVTLLRQDLIREARPLLLVLWAAAAFVLLIACANVANLILARMSRREHELMVRTAVGAGSTRLFRQLLTESFFLALLASCFGLLFTFGTLELMKDFVAQLTPRAREISVDRGVLFFAILCTTITTVVFGSVASLHFRQDLSSGLKEGGRTGAEGGSQFLRRLLIAAQIAFSFVLLIGAGLMVRSFIKLSQVNPGFAPQNVMVARISLDSTKFASAEQRYSLGQRIQETISGLPGVISAAVSSSFPMDRENQFGGRPIRFQVENDPRPESESPPVTNARSATPDYFKTLGIPLRAGRLFRDSDTSKAPQVILINQSLATKRWGHGDPVGKRIMIDNGQTWLTIIGVVGDVKEFGLKHDTPYEIYFPFSQASFLGSVLVRTAGSPAAMSETLRRMLQQIEPRMAVVRLETMEQARQDSIASSRTLTRLFLVFAALALAIAITGIGSMLALWVRQRTREIGIRMALGASPRKILTALVRQGMVLSVAGVVAGLLVALGFSRLLTSLLFRVKSTDAATYVVVAVLLLIAALVACYIPARRAAQVDPQLALRSE